MQITVGSRGIPDTRLLEEIFAKRPLLRSILEQHGQNSLQKFSAQNLASLTQPSADRKNIFLDVIEEIVTERLGTEEAKIGRAQLEETFMATSADHHGSLNSSLAVSASALIASGKPLQTLLVLSCASVSLNNEDYPRGLMFHSGNDVQKLSLLPSNSHSSLVYGFRPYKEEEVSKVEKVLRQAMREKTVTEDDGAVIAEVLKTIYRDPQTLTSPTLCAQITRINHALWKRYFGNNSRLPSLHFVELEELTKRLLIKHHLSEETPLQRLFFDGAHTKTLQELTDAMEEFLRQGQSNTHLFWGITEHSHQRVSLTLQNGTLSSADGEFRIQFTPSAIATALEAGTIMPNLLVIYSLVHCYYGMNCFGGFNQMHYLDSMKKMYRTSGIDPQAPDPRSTLYGYGMDLLFLETSRGKTPIFGMDLLLTQQSHLWDDVTAAFDRITLLESFSASIHIIHGLLYPDHAS